MLFADGYCVIAVYMYILGNLILPVYITFFLSFGFGEDGYLFSLLFPYSFAFPTLPYVLFI